MSDPQQPSIPPYASNAGLPSQPDYPAQPAPAAPPVPATHQYHQSGTPQPQPQYNQNSQPSYSQAPQSQAPYASAPYSQAGHSSAASGSTSPNAPGRIGFIIGLVGLAVSLLSSVIVQIMIRTSDYALISLVSGGLSVIAFLASLAALVFGIVGLRRPGAPHGLAGIATGLGGAGIIGIGGAFIINAISLVFYF